MRTKYGNFIKIENMNISRTEHQLFLLRDGRILGDKAGKRGKTNLPARSFLALGDGEFQDILSITEQHLLKK